MRTLKLCYLNYVVDHTTLFNHIVECCSIRHLMFISQLPYMLCYILFIIVIWSPCYSDWQLCLLPNQELSGAKSELPGGTVGVCSFHKGCGQLPYNLPITHLRFTPRSLQMCLLAHFNK